MRGIIINRNWLSDTVQGGADFIANVATGGGYGAGNAQEQANQTNIEEAQKNRNFQERMSNTGYQRAMDDMEGAGLNRMLAFSKGPASTPSGAQATVSPVNKMGKIAAGMTGMVEKSLGMRNVSSSTDVNTQAAKTSGTQAELNDANKNLADKNAEKTAFTAQYEANKAKISANDVKISDAGLKANKAAAANMPYFKMLGSGLQSVGTAAGAFMGLKGLGKFAGKKKWNNKIGKDNNMPLGNKLNWEDYSPSQRNKILRDSKGGNPFNK